MAPTALRLSRLPGGAAPRSLGRRAAAGSARAPDPGDMGGEPSSASTSRGGQPFNNFPALDPRAAIGAAAQLLGGGQAAPETLSKPLELAGKWLGGAARAAWGSSTSSGVDATNDVFAALGLKMWVVTPSCKHARVQLRVRGDSAPDLPKAVEPGAAATFDCEELAKVPFGGLSPRQFIQFMRGARRSGVFGDRLETYLNQLQAEGRLQPIPMISVSLQNKIYLDLSRIIVFAFHRAVLALDDAELWGHRVQLTKSPVFNKMGSAKMRTSVGKEQLEVIVENILASRAVKIPVVPRALERRLFTNCMMVVFQLINELLSGEGEEVTFLGHRLRFFLEPEPVDIVRRCLEESPVTHCHINEAAVAELVEELLADDETNILWIPDAIESQIYQGVMRLMIRIVEHVVCRLRLNFLGRDIHMSILSDLDLRARKERLDQMEKRANTLYYEEEDPLRTVSTTELEERLKDLGEQRKVLQALHELRKASFDLTADTPLQQRSARSAPRGADSEGEGRSTNVADLSDLTSASDPEATGSGDGQGKGHEFHTLAHTLKLARSLSVKVDVDADIEVTHGMIADLETYPVWMPWCTSGRIVRSAQPVPDTDGHVSLEGQVGFGFETGTFLGTVGDTVHYSVLVKAPKEALPGTQGVARRAGVTADAVNGFTYGKRLVYDWRFTEVAPKKTRVELDLLFQAHSVLYMPVWDSLQNMIVNNMLSAFKARADQLQASRAAQAGASPDTGSTSEQISK